MVFIEFSKSNRKFILPIEEIKSVEQSDGVTGAAIVNGAIIDQMYEDVIDLLGRFTCNTVDRELTIGEQEA